MKRIPLSTGQSISRIVQGYMRLADWKKSDAELDAFIRAGLDIGITTVDHADIYGGYTVEALFGNVLKKQKDLREKLEIVTKCGIVHTSYPYRKIGIKHYDYSFNHIVESVDRSLSAFGTDYLDVLLLHRPSPLWEAEEIAQAFDQLAQTGKVRSFGVSNFQPHQITYLQSELQIDLAINQLEISSVETGYFRDGTIDFGMMNNIVSMAWSPIGGLPHRHSDAQQRVFEALNELAPEYGVDWSVLAIAWILYHPSGLVPLIGTGSLERVQALQNVDNMELTLEHWYRIYTASTGKNVP
ncbi:MAG: aldo/keto reductase [Bacteroidetes bacterium]|nr:aldo/keto reductase [Bacteroidota bacterium]